MYKWAGVLLIAVMLTGCLFVVDSRQQVGQTQWSNDQVERIALGETDAEWIRTTFGEPDRATDYGEGNEVWRYRNSSRKESEIGLFLLFHVNVEKDSEEVLALEIKEGVVTDYWVESRTDR